MTDLAAYKQVRQGDSWAEPSAASSGAFPDAGTLHEGAVSLTVSADRRGLVVSLPDSKGKVHEYVCAVALRTRDGWRVRMAKQCQDGEQEVYHPRLGPKGWGCGCKAFAFGKGRVCKHCRAGEKIVAVYDAMRGT